MSAKFHAHARELTELAYTELIALWQIAEKLAETHETITRTIYEDLGNTNFNHVMNRVAGILGTYRSQEMRKISAYKGRESARRPTNNDDWRIALENKQGTQVTSASQGQACSACQETHVLHVWENRQN